MTSDAGMASSNGPGDPDNPTHPVLPTLTDLRPDALRILAATGLSVGDDGVPVDVAGILAAGRSELGEADLVRSLVAATTGDDPVQLLQTRTEPLIVAMNVAQLVDVGEMHPGLLGLDDALDAYPLPDDDDTQSIAWEKWVAVEDRYAREFTRYGEQFAAAVQCVAAAGVTVQTVVRLDVDPRSWWWEPGAIVNPDSAGDPLVLALWRQAHAMVPLPNVDMRRPR